MIKRATVLASIAAVLALAAVAHADPPANLRLSAGSCHGTGVEHAAPPGRHNPSQWILVADAICEASVDANGDSNRETLGHIDVVSSGNDYVALPGGFECCSSVPAFPPACFAPPLP